MSNRSRPIPLFVHICQIKTITYGCLCLPNQDTPLCVCVCQIKTDFFVCLCLLCVSVSAKSRLISLYVYVLFVCLCLTNQDWYLCVSVSGRLRLKTACQHWPSSALCQRTQVSSPVGPRTRPARPSAPLNFMSSVRLRFLVVSCLVSCCLLASVSEHR